MKIRYEDLLIYDSTDVHVRFEDREECITTIVARSLTENRRLQAMAMREGLEVILSPAKLGTLLPADLQRML